MCYKNIKFSVFRCYWVSEEIIGKGVKYLKVVLIWHKLYRIKENVTVLYPLMIQDWKKNLLLSQRESFVRVKFFDCEISMSWYISEHSETKYAFCVHHNSKLDRDIKFIFGSYIEFILKWSKLNYIIDRILLSI